MQLDEPLPKTVDVKVFHIMIVKPEVPEAIDVAFVDPDVMEEFADISDEGDSLSAEI